TLPLRSTFILHFLLQLGVHSRFGPVPKPDGDIVRVKTGAQGGVIVHHFHPGYTIELAKTYLACTGISLSHLWEASASLEIAALEQFTKRADASVLEELRRAYRKLEQGGSADYLLRAVEFHQLIADHSGNRALSLLVGILLRFDVEFLPEPDARYLPRFKADHLRTIDMVAAGDHEAATSLMWQMFDHSRRWILRVEGRNRFS
ncbi:MAG: FCD domain-containing protein, partial [Novosphingobium sp.]